MQIHKEGYRIITNTVIILTTLCLICWLAFGKVALLISLLFAVPFLIFVLRFFRVPSRIPKLEEGSVISPCDGKVVAIEEVFEPEYLNERCLQVSIFMSVWNVHINWFPIGGNVLFKKYHPGKFLLAWEPKSSTLNERTTVVVENAKGQKVLFRQIAGYLARRIICYPDSGEIATQCQQMGFIKFGSRVDLYLPLGSKVNVEINQKVKGTQTSIATLP
jgi:phosphatidylserine decarboxylase